MVNYCAFCCNIQNEKWRNIVHFDELFSFVKVLTIRRQKQSGNKIYKIPDNWGYLVNKSYKKVTERGHFSDRKFQNGYKNRLGSYNKQHHNHVLNY